MLILAEHWLAFQFSFNINDLITLFTWQGWVSMVFQFVRIFWNSVRMLARGDQGRQLPQPSVDLPHRTEPRFLESCWTSWIRSSVFVTDQSSSFCKPSLPYLQIQYQHFTVSLDCLGVYQASSNSFLRESSLAWSLYSNGSTISSTCHFSLRKRLYVTCSFYRSCRFEDTDVNYCRKYASDKQVGRFVSGRRHYPKYKYHVLRHYWCSLLALSGCMQVALGDAAFESRMNLK